MAGVDFAKQQDSVDSDRIAAIGYCFGGLCVLELARSGAALRGVASFHGLLSKDPDTANETITARIIAFHGWDDPFVPPDQVREFTEEMSAANADWQLHAYGNTLHSFTKPMANDPENGIAYNASAEQSSWQALTHFLRECFEPPAS